MTDEEMMDILTGMSNDEITKLPRDAWAEIAVRFQALVYAARRAEDDAKYEPVGLTAEVPKAYHYGEPVRDERKMAVIYQPAQEKVTGAGTAWRDMTEHPDHNGLVLVAMETEAGRIVAEPADFVHHGFFFWTRDGLNMFPIPSEMMHGWLPVPEWGKK